MKIASFNINGIKARAAALPEWLDEAQPDDIQKPKQISSRSAGSKRNPSHCQRP